LEKEFGANVASAGYVGSLGRHLESQPDINFPTTSTSGYPIASLPGAHIEQLSSIGASTYDALQLSLRRRFTAGLNATVNYGWSHSLGDTSPIGETTA
jgi:hypothetical protein